jgi:gentisate 1,2-dioxygenase
MSQAARQNYREDVAGRANVEDTPELIAYYDELEKLETGALWTVANKIEPWQPKSASVPVLWRIRAGAMSRPRSAGSIPACR